jgi:hypothetical protein
MDSQNFKNGKLLSELSSQYEAFYGKVNVQGKNTFLELFISQFKFSFYAEVPKDLKILAFVLTTDNDGDVSLIVKYKFEYMKKYFWWELNLIGSDIDKNEIRETK